ncbi:MULTISPECIES: aromatic ring-hydroxylating dioxygenase subunit alpha [Nostoc]|uniref:Aromatic ring-hydroxylating dioxygenase subunit alpha n=1 Tax=Nostoc paludosum FACHB-159 TaxID=2692908 RepID=A0ABR8KHL5_9NOSO|nr:MULTISPECIES: aromatic ring-hydroxylating dioxygenase subunit alpha [Nostoc]MBD2682707.1 aromatic ring-hydroxylating dioxygenase subunit alpha [Nostoc sp. FACHB-857]MBD2739041.1 aromatic ring-hydroxylating dioxygenase subunit alpha [Nostoc paludosum FACHB-159]
MSKNLKNFWYVCEFSANITDKPLQTVIFNEKFVLYRNRQGQVVILKDQCPHRGAALSLGWVEDGCIRCPYHGWKFQDDGKCIDIPANSPETPIPQRAKVQTYAVQEKYGFVWLFYGDLPEAERPPLPTNIPEYLFASSMRAAPHVDLDKANYVRLMETNLDFAHVIAIHRKSFGQRIPLNSTVKYDVDEQDYSAVAKFTYDSLSSSKSVLNFLLGGRPRVTLRLSFYLPNFTLAEINVGGDSRWAIKFAVLAGYCPIDEKTTSVKRILFRNVLPFPWLDKFFIKLDSILAHEDTIVIESLDPQPLPDVSEEIHVAADGLGIALRKLQQKYLAKGWSLEASEKKLPVSALHK